MMPGPSDRGPLRGVRPCPGSGATWRILPLSVWVNYEVLRRSLDLDLGTMQLDAEGNWIDPGPIRADLGISFESDAANGDTTDDTEHNGVRDVRPLSNIDNWDTVLVPVHKDRLGQWHTKVQDEE